MATKKRLMCGGTIIRRLKSKKGSAGGQSLCKRGGFPGGIGGSRHGEDCSRHDED